MLKYMTRFIFASESVVQENLYKKINLLKKLLFKKIPCFLIYILDNKR